MDISSPTIKKKECPSKYINLFIWRYRRYYNHTRNLGIEIRDPVAMLYSRCRQGDRPLLQDRRDRYVGETRSRSRNVDGKPRQIQARRQKQRNIFERETETEETELVYDIFSFFCTFFFFLVPEARRYEAMHRRTRQVLDKEGPRGRARTTQEAHEEERLAIPFRYWQSPSPPAHEWIGNSLRDRRRMWSDGST